MSYFYDLENPQTSNGESRNSLDIDVVSYARNGRNVVEKSTKSPRERERARVVKARQQKQKRQKRVAILCAACLALGGVAVNTIGNIAENLTNDAIVYSEVGEFRRDVITPNTHPTADRQHHFYDYIDIAICMKEDGKDFSSELFKAYSILGEYQTDLVMRHTDYESVDAYVTQAGFESIEDWVDSEKQKILYQYDVSKKQAELDSMHKELNGQQVINAVQDVNLGGK